MVLKTPSPKQGEVWLFDPDPVKGRELGKKIRPCLIMSCNILNTGSSGLVIIVPITSTHRNIFSHVRLDPPEGGLKTTSFAISEQIRAISTSRLVSRLGKIKNSAKIHEIHSWIKDFLWIET